MAFGRKVNLSIGSQGRGLLISDLDIDFRVTRSTTFSENTAEFTIYNAKEQTRKEILRKGNNVLFSAGYRDEVVGNIFIGNITESVSYRSGTEWITKIEAVSARSETQPLTAVNVSLSYASNTQMKQVVRDLSVYTGLPIFGLANINFTLINGWVFVGSVRSAFDYVREILEDNGLGIYFDNSQIVIYRLGIQDSRFGVTFLTYNNGLLSVQEKTETGEDKKKISFKSLLISSIQPNGLVTIRTDKIAGTFFVEKVTHSGKNYGGGSDFTTEGEASE